MTPENITAAISDIQFIKRALRHGDQGKPAGITLKSHIMLHSCALFFAMGLLVFEIFSNHSMTSTLLVSANSPELQQYGLGFMACVLLGLMLPIYFTVWRASKHNRESLKGYLAKEFAYLDNLSLVSDLALKAFTIGILVMLNKPEWVAAALVIFIGDYLLQSRFYVLGVKSSLFFGIGCFALALVMMLQQKAELSIPLTVFCLTFGVSLAQLVIESKRQVNV